MKNFIKITLSVLIGIAGLWLLQRLFVPKYADDVIEGNLIKEYYDDEKNHDVVFIGDCEVYENFSPAVLWEEYGINSYIRGSAQQLIWQSYYLLEDTLRYETPKVVIFNVLSMKYNEPQNEGYNRMSIEGMAWSKSKVDNINASMMEDEHFIEYVFPILRYHSRWNEINQNDIDYMFTRKKVSFNGYYMRVDEKAAENVPEGPVLPNYEFGETSYEYLDKITNLCQEKGITLILIKAPSLYPYWYDQWELQIEDYAKAHNLTYINFLELIDETGIDFEHDTYDGGLHMNLSGATKLSRYIGDYIINNTSVEDRRGEEPLSTNWSKKLKEYNDEITRQKESL